MDTFNIFPELEKKFANAVFVLRLNENLEIVFKTNFNERIIEVSRMFQLLNPIVQEFIIWQVIYVMEFSEPNDINSLVESDMKAFHKVIDEYGNQYEGLLFLSMKLLLAEGETKKERLTNLYYQLSNKNQ